MLTSGIRAKFGGSQRRIGGKNFPVLLYDPINLAMKTPHHYNQQPLREIEAADANNKDGDHGATTR
jgi:hypothetical protein